MRLTKSNLFRSFIPEKVSHLYWPFFLTVTTNTKFHYHSAIIASIDHLLTHYYYIPLYQHQHQHHPHPLLLQVAVC